MSAHTVMASGLQAALNNVLALDPELAEGLAELEGSVLEVHFKGIERRLQLYPSDSGVTVIVVDEERDHVAVAADVVISGPPFTLLRLLASMESVNGVLPPGVSISGELQLVQKLTALAQRTNIDWEEWLSKLFGDSVAHELGRGIRGFALWASTASETFTSDIGEYLREERRLSPTRLETEDFFNYVDQTRDDVERLEHRIARLETRVREL